MRIYRISAPPPRIDGNGERFVLFAPSLCVAREQWRAACDLCTDVHAVDPSEDTE